MAPFRCDYHIGDTDKFIARCSEMHICCDNQCYLDARHNKTIMEHFLKNIDDIFPNPIDIIWNKLLGWEIYLPYGYTDLPQKTRYLIIDGDKKTEYYEYLGLSEDEIKRVESFKRRWRVNQG